MRNVFIKILEKHLTKKDIFYYNNLSDISHSKIYKYMTFDIETNFSLDVVNTPKEIISISFSDVLSDKYYCLIFNKNNQIIDKKRFVGKHIVEFNSEIEMLESFFDILKNFDVLVAWNLDRFDLPYLVNRARCLNIKVEDYLENLYISIDSDSVKIYNFIEIHGLAKRILRQATDR